MKINILQQDLLPVLQSVSRSIGIKNNLPVLSNLLLVAEGQKLKVAATNLEVGVIKFISCEVIDPGEITIPAKTLTEIVSGIGAAKLEIESVGESITISAGKFKANINGISATEFPAIPVSPEKLTLLPKEVIKACLQILFASAVDEGRPQLTGILTQLSNQRIDFVATDGFRLAYRQVELTTDDKFKALIPKRTFEELIHIINEDLAGVDDQVGIGISENQNQIIFQIGLTTLSSRLIDGNFPSWEKIIPTEHVARIIVERQTLLSAVKLASVFAKGEANIITLNLTPEKLTLISEAKELGRQENEVECQIEGKALEIAFNARFLTESLSASSSSQLIMEFSGEITPTLIKPVGEEGLQYIIMPIRKT